MIPELVRKAAVRQVETFCGTRILAHVRNEIRLEYSVRGNAITLVERRSPGTPS